MTLPSSPPADPAAAPQPTVAGTFAMFDLPGGGVHVVVHMAGEDDERHSDIPPAIAAVARQLIAEGSMAGALRALASRRHRKQLG